MIEFVQWSRIVRSAGIFDEAAHEEWLRFLSRHDSARSSFMVVTDDACTKSPFGPVLNGDGEDAFMTTPGEMVKCAAAALGVPEMTLTQIDRELVTNGMRSKGGRGKSAAKMNAGDVTNLLIAAASGSLVKDTVQTVKSYSGLPGNPSGKWVLEGFLLPSVLALPPDHTFGQALKAFLDTFVEGEFQAALDALPVTMAGKFVVPRTYHLEFRLRGPYPQAGIRLIVDGLNPIEHRYNLNPGPTDDLNAWAARHEEEFGAGDLRREHWFTHRTMRKLFDFLRGEATT